MSGLTRRFTVLLLVAAMTVVAACGGGNGGGDKSDPPVTPTKGLLSAGVIAGFGGGYVNLNGVAYGTDDVTVIVDDQAATVAQLKVGQYVELKGHSHEYWNYADHDADEIRYHNVLEGPITTIDPVAGSLVAMGQVVRVTLDTVFGDGIQPASIAALEVGDVVEVSGVVPLVGPVDATRIDIQPDGGPYDVTGYVSNVRADANRFDINGLVVDYNNANMEDFPGGDPAAGDLVLVKGFVFDPDGTFAATRVELRSDDWLMPGTGDAVEIVGIVVNFVSATDFHVGGWQVTTTAATQFEHGAIGDLADGVMVRVKGEASLAGTLVASRIAFMQVSEVLIVAQIAELDAVAGTLRLLGLEVATDAMTRYEDMSLLRMRDFGFDDLTLGAWVDVRGYEETEGSGAVRATRVVRIDPADSVRLRGPFRDPERPDFHILTVRVDTTDTTRFVLEGNVRLTLDQFFTQAPGELVEAWGSGNGVALAADRVELKVSDD